MLSERIVKVRLCKRCPHNCKGLKPQVIGCMSVYVPVSQTPWHQFLRRGYFCVRRVWFNRDYEPVDFWRWPSSEELRENPSEMEWEERLRFELTQLKKKEREVRKRDGEGRNS